MFWVGSSLMLIVALAPAVAHSLRLDPITSYTVRAPSGSEPILDDTNDADGFWGLITNNPNVPPRVGFNDEFFIEFDVTALPLDVSSVVLDLTVIPIFFLIPTPTGAATELRVAWYPASGTPQVSNFGTGTEFSRVEVPVGTATSVSFTLPVGDVLMEAERASADFIGFRLFGPTRVPDLGRTRQLRYVGAVLAPEPSRALLFLLGLLTLVARSRAQ